MIRRFNNKYSLSIVTVAAATNAARLNSSSNQNQQQQQQQDEEEDGNTTSEKPIYAGHFRVHHDSPGTGRFVAHGYGKPNSPYEDSISIVATCDISDRMIGLREYLQEKQRNASSVMVSDGSSSNNNQHQSPTAANNNSNTSTKDSQKLWRLRRELTRPMSEDDEASRTPPPINFSIYIENIAPSHSNNPSGDDAVMKAVNKGGGVCIVASCLGDACLSIDGLSFVPSVRHALDRSVAAAMARRDTYQGPQLHQGVLAECAFSTSLSTPSPVYPPRQHRLLSMRPNFNAKYSPFARYGAHFPVHTVQPELYDAVHAWCRALGIDDVFARDMRRIAMETAEAEMKSWKRNVLELLDVEKYKKVKRG